MECDILFQAVFMHRFKLAPLKIRLLVALSERWNSKAAHDFLSIFQEKQVFSPSSGVHPD